MHTVLREEQIRRGADLHMKAHVCETSQILASVKQDMISRGITTFTELPNESIAIDFGGSVLSSTQWHRIPGTTVAFLNQHCSLLKRAIEKATLRDGYWKIHAERAVCLSTQTYEDVARYLVEDEQELLQLEAGVFEAFIDARMRLRGHPNIGLGR